MNTSIRTFDAAATASKSRLTSIYSDLSAQRGAYVAYLSDLANDGVIDTKTVGFASVLASVKRFGDLLSLSRDLVENYSL